LITDQYHYGSHQFYPNITCDLKTIPKALEQYERLNRKKAKDTFVNREYKGIKQYKGAAIHIPIPDKISLKPKGKNSRRTVIEPVIGHLKEYYRLCRNYLKEIISDNMNVILVAVAMNFNQRIN
jgi:transposase, IS5 family